MPIPPAPYAFASIPDVDTRADRVVPGELALSLVRGGGYLGFTRNGWQETLGVHITSGAPEQLIVLPRATYLPLGIALATAGAVLAMLFQFYLLSLATALLVAGLFVSGAQGAGLARDYGPMPVGHDVSLPPHTEVASAPPWWALIFTLIADGTLFTSCSYSPPSPRLPSPQARRVARFGQGVPAVRRRAGSHSPYWRSLPPSPRSWS
jgi:cytochrome c oxidase subunit I+III